MSGILKIRFVYSSFKNNFFGFFFLTNRIALPDSTIYQKSLIDKSKFPHLTLNFKTYFLHFLKK
jgi:hypothetical protein